MSHKEWLICEVKIMMFYLKLNFTNFSVCFTYFRFVILNGPIGNIQVLLLIVFLCICRNSSLIRSA